jgi:hypothetical protein
MAALTRAQILVLRALVTGDPTINGQIGVADQPILDYFNANTTFQVWRTTTPVSEIQDAIIWANFTPSNPGAGAGQDFANWALACQGKQFNLQNLLQAGSVFGGGVSTNRANIRAGLQDACTQIPSGTNGNLKSGGWTAIQLIIQRPATKAEQALATGTGTAVAPGDLGWDGQITGNDLYFILGRDGN